LSATESGIERAEHGRGSSAWVLSTYFAEGLPYSVVHQVASQLFTAMHASLESIGLVSLYGLAWLLKFVWSPLVDLVGTARRWLVILQLLLAVALACVAWPAHHGDLQLVAKILVVVAILAATHDIAIDAYYLRSLSSRRQSSYAGLRVSAYRVALLVGNGALVWVGGSVSWLACFGLAAALMLGLAIGHHLALPQLPKPICQEPARSASQRPGFVDAFLSFFLVPHAWLAVPFIVMFRLGDAMLFSMSSPLLRDLGMSTAMRGMVSGVAGTTVGIAGAMAAAAVITRRGLHRTLVPITAIQAAALPIYVLLATFRPPTAIVVVAVLIEQLAAAVGTAGFSVFLMRRCAGAYKAAHFAIATALMTLPATGMGAASGYLAKALGFPWFFGVSSVAALPGLVLALVLAPRLAPTAEGN
jgi:MFS transporter, PAT family, beta-lactamase induction signal transducer AmpG